MTAARARSRTSRSLLALLAAAALTVTGLVATPGAPAAAAPGVVTLVGSLQSKAGCAADWDPSCAATDLAPTSTAGVYAADLTLPGGSYEYKIAFDRGWDGAVGLDGGAANIPLVTGGTEQLRFSYDVSTQRVTVTPLGLAAGYSSADDGLVGSPVREAGSGNQYYFVMTDRFANGSTANDTAGLGTDRMVSGFDPTDKGFYHGGDLAGLTSKLDYVHGLGTTAIWLTPSFKNKPVQGTGADASAGYHGYWTTDFTQIDPHLGTNDEMKTLIADAHAKGMKVYFDIITNHTADVISNAQNQYTYVSQADKPYKAADGTVIPDIGALANSPSFPTFDAATSFPYTPVVAPADANVKVPSWLNDVTLYHNRGDSTYTGESTTLGDFSGLDDLMTENPKVVSGMEQIYESWIDLGIDGFRIDTAKHVNFEFWKAWTQPVLDYAHTHGKPDFFMFGEVYDADSAKTAPYVRDTAMSSVLDFSFQSAATSYAKGGSAKSLQALYASDDRYTTTHSSADALPTFLGNHDMGRIGYFLAGQPDPMARDELANDLMFFSRGQPIVYYGDEQGFAGTGGDKDARQDMFATQTASYANQPLVDGTTAGSKDRYDTTSTLYQHIAALSALRSGNPALAHGAQIERYAQDGTGVYAFSRVDRTEKVENLVAVNNAASTQTVTFTTLTPGASYTVLYGGGYGVTADGSGKVTLTVPALSAVVLRADRQVAAVPSRTLSVSVPSAGAGVSGLTPVEADATDGWGETSFAYRVVGSGTWTGLGTAESGAPRVFADVSGLAPGTLLEYRAVSVDAAGNHVAASTYASVGNRVDGVVAGGGSGTTLQVSVPGSFNSAVGCTSDWAPDCAAIALTKRPDGVYAGTFTLPAGSYEYKVAIGGSWNENYGAGGVPGGANIAFTTTGGPVTFYYDATTHYAQNTAQGPIVTAPGSYQSAIGCPGDWAPDCMGSWLEDLKGDGVYTFTTSAIPSGSYQAKAAVGLSWNENYGAGGVPGGPNIDFTATTGKQVTFTYTAATHVLTILNSTPPLPGTGQELAQWVDAGTVAVPPALVPSGTDPAALTWTLRSSQAGDLAVTDGKLSGAGTTLPLSVVSGGLTADQLHRFPALTGYLALHVGADRAAVATALTGQLRLVQQDGTGALTAFTGVQVPGVLDDLDAASAQTRKLGVTWARGVPSLAVWAPTAQQVAVVLDPATSAAAATVVPATRQPDGTWTVTGDRSWKNRGYLYRLTVPTADGVVTNDVTDPYSVALTTNATRSVVADLSDPALEPDVWRTAKAPTIPNESARTAYELHVRDFSATDTTVPAGLRGTYDAFTVEDSAGMTHLKDLAKAGLNTVQLQPVFDFATVNEDKSTWQQPACDLPSLPAASDQQQACSSAVAAKDGFNWGYDPLHWLAPDGSYAVQTDGPERTAEVRSMVGSLHRAGLQVVLDQVYNHTSASGQSDASVLDRVVPGYYQRLDAKGAVQTSTCCSNVATEHAMAGKLMVDGVVLWAQQYKVDGFRFDLMGFHSVQNMKDVRAALDKLTLKRDGVDGSKVALYGEGWNFGEVANNALFTQASQGQLGGTGIGTFNDRLRDAVRGGSPVDSSSVQAQGYGSGLGTDPNGVAVNGTPAQQAAALAHAEDLIKVGLAGNLRAFTFTASDGTVKRGDQIDYNGQPAGYADQPDEVVNYVDAHDNQTLYDALALKLPKATTMADRVRMQTLSLAAATLSQSRVMWLAGTDLLRSKSMDNDSYDSGDWFNRVDWTGTTSTWGSGLPPAAKNSGQWPVMAPLLADPALKPSAADMAAATAQAQTLLTIKASSPLFRLDDAAAIEQKVSFPTTDPGVIAMWIDDTRGADVDKARDGVLVVFNASTTPVSEHLAGLSGHALTLSKAQAHGSDPVVKTTRWDSATGTVTVPPRTVVVLEQKQHGAPWTGPWGGAWWSAGPWSSGGPSSSDGPWSWGEPWSWLWSWSRG